eukprot:4680776-Alexandrium_andersonii.AAC.1
MNERADLSAREAADLRDQHERKLCLYAEARQQRCLAVAEQVRTVILSALRISMNWKSSDSSEGRMLQRGP